MTAFESWENAVSTMKAGADDFISKGFGLDELTLRIDNLLKKKRQIDHLEFENRILKETIQQQYSDYKIVGKAPIIKKLITKINKVAAVCAPVKDPLSCPNNSLSMRLAGSEAQLTVTKGFLFLILL